MSFFFFLSTNWIFAQNPVPVQVSVPVYFEDVEFTHLQSPDKPPVTHLCGIAFYFLDTSVVKDKIIVSNLFDPIIWVDKVGISTKVKFIVSDSASIRSLDLLYANGACSVEIVENEQIVATGSVTQDFGRYALRLVGPEILTEKIVELIGQINKYLLYLHSMEQMEIPVSPLFDPDSLNVIIGPDRSFDTNYDLYWFDETLRNRIKNLAIKAYMAIDRDESQNPLKESVQTNAWVEHIAEKVPGYSNMTRGKVSTLFKMKGKKNYLFLQSNQEYLMEIGYKYEKWKTSSGRLMIERFLVKNIGNDDFIEMKIFDYTWNGVPLLYVDLIQGVVMEDNGAWKANEIISAIQDIFRLVKLPHER